MSHWKTEYLSKIKGLRSMISYGSILDEVLKIPSPSRANANPRTITIHVIR